MAREATVVEVETVNGPIEAMIPNAFIIKGDLLDVEVIGRVSTKYYVRLPASPGIEEQNVWVDEDQFRNDGW